MGLLYLLPFTVSNIYKSSWIALGMKMVKVLKFFFLTAIIFGGKKIFKEYPQQRTTTTDIS
jgi:hypothetical protein